MTGRYSRVVARRPSAAEVVGAVVAWTVRFPTVPVKILGRHYRGPGYRVFIDSLRFVDLGATQTGNLVRDGLNEGDRVLTWIAHRIGGSPR